MKILFIPLRLAMKLQQEHGEIEVRIFLMAAAVTAALPKQTTPQGCYNIERMLKAVLDKKGEVHTCGSCVEARGLQELSLMEGAAVGTMSQLAEWVVDADKILTF